MLGVSVKYTGHPKLKSTQHPGFESSSGQTIYTQQKLGSGLCYRMSTDAQKIYGKPGD